MKSEDLTEAFVRAGFLTLDLIGLPSTVNDLGDALKAVKSGAVKAKATLKAVKKASASASDIKRLDKNGDGILTADDGAIVGELNGQKIYLAKDGKTLMPCTSCSILKEADAADIQRWESEGGLPTQDAGIPHADANAVEVATQKSILIGDAGTVHVTARGGATLSRLTPEYAKTIQDFADKYQVDVTVVGSRVNPSKVPTATSDWDYVINPAPGVKPAKSMRDILKSGTYYLPKGRPRTDGMGNTRSGVDVERSVPIDPTLPSVTFHPRISKE